MIVEYLGVIIGVIIGFIIGAIITKRHVKTVTRKIDNEIIQEEEKIRNRIISLMDREERLLYQIDLHEKEKDEYEKSFIEKQKQDKAILEKYHQEKLELINQQVESEYALSREKLKQNIAEITLLENTRLEERLQKNREDFELKIAELSSAIDEQNNTLHQLKLKRDAAIEDAKRQEEMKTKNKFYKLQLSESDLADILELKSIEAKLVRKDVLNKLIYKVYFEKPYTDLIGRVIGKNIKTGIYKITNTLNQKVYIGQAVNIAERWKQHIKRALGAEPLTQNKLYPAMVEDGVWNFTFEIVEVCEKSQLSEREQYWQNFFGAKEYGYSIK